MPITVSNMAAIQAAINAQTTALNTTINAARDNVNANVDADAASVAAAVNAARDNVKADTTAQLATQTTAINSNTDTRTGAVTTAVNNRGVARSIQRGVAIPSGATSSRATLNITISAVDLNKAQVVISGVFQQSGNNVSNYSARLTSATNLEISGWVISTGHLVEVNWQVVEYF